MRPSSRQRDQFGVVRAVKRSIRWSERRDAFPSHPSFDTWLLGERRWTFRVRSQPGITSIEIDPEKL
jgi:hypothetical protein